LAVNFEELQHDPRVEKMILAVGSSILVATAYLRFVG